MTTATITDPWAPVNSALARLEHKTRLAAAEQRQRVYLDTLRAEWQALTAEQRDEIWGGEEATRFLDLPEFMTYGREVAA